MKNTIIAHAVKQHQSPYKNGLKHHSARATLPPTPNGKSILILDLDETLVSCDLDLVTSEDGFPSPESIRLRPHLKKFLSVADKFFDLVIWTAGITRYAEMVVEKIQRETGFSFSCCLSRRHCTPVPDPATFGGTTYVKDLGRFQAFLKISQHQVAILDNSPKAYSFQVENGIPIKDWYGEPDDEELAIMAQKFSNYVCRYGPDSSMQTFAQAVQGKFASTGVPPRFNSACDRIQVAPKVEKEAPEDMDWEYSTEEECENISGLVQDFSLLQLGPSGRPPDISGLVEKFALLHLGPCGRPPHITASGGEDIIISGLVQKLSMLHL